MTLIMCITLYALMHLIKLEKTGDRNTNYALSQDVCASVKTDTQAMTEDEIIEYSLNRVAAELEFAVHNNISNGKANCIGYAQLCAAICNVAFDANRLQCRAEPVVGIIKLGPIDLCHLASSILPSQQAAAFVQDHDFVEIKSTDKTFFIDPSIFDYMGNPCFTIAE